MIKETVRYEIQLPRFDYWAQLVITFYAGALTGAFLVWLFL